jgi:hypothetical protein
MNRVLYDTGLRIHKFNGLHRFATYSEPSDAVACINSASG